MAKTVKPFELRLKVLGDEAVKRLGSSFRDLDKALNVSNNKIKQLRNEVLNYNREGQQSEQLIKGQITALKSLQGQVQVNGKVYQKLGADVANLKAKLDGTTSSVQEQRAAILKSVSATKLSSGAAAGYIKQLEKLKEQTVENSKASKDFEQDIDKLKTKLAELKAAEGKAFGEGAKGAFAGLINGGQKATNAIDVVTRRFARLGREAKTASGAWNRILEGIGALGVGASAAGPALSGLEIGTAVNAAKLSAQQGAAGFLGKIPGPLQDYMQGRSAELQSALADTQKFQSVLEGLHSATDGILSALTQFGPEAAAATAIGGAAFAGLFDLIKRHTNETEGELKGAVARIRDVFESMSMELPKLLREYRRLSSEQIGGLLSDARGEFAMRPAGAARSRALASQIAGLESIGAQEAARQADVLEEYRQRVRGTREDAQALGDRLAYVQGKLKTLDQTTEEGRAEFAQFSSEAISLTDKLQKLGDGYRHVSTMATQAATAQENAVNAAVRLNYLNFGAAQAQRAAMAELGQRVRAAVTSTPLALPAAGQTSAPGTGQAISGGARQFRGAVETTFDQPNFRRARTRGIRAGYYSPTTADVGQPAAVGMSDQAIQAQAAAAKKAAVDLTQYDTAIRQAREANTGSIASTNNLRQALVAMRDQLDPTSNKFRTLTRQIEELDAKSAKYALKQKKRSLGRNVRAGVGSALSGAVFGGPEAAVGGLVGGLVGGIAGGAAGAGLGAQASMFRQSIAGAADYAAQLEKMRIALRGVAGGQAEYEKALSISERVTDRFNVSQAESITGITRLTAAVTGAGGKVFDAGLVFENVTAAIKATGGSTEDVNSAITAMVQVFSKGKVSAEELSGQLGERLPGAVTLFAKANNMSLTELQKNLKDGTVGLNELMKFVVELGNKYGDTADKISGSGEEAGARLQVLINDLRADLGEALQPVGEELQNTFAEFLKTNRQAITEFVQNLSKTLLELVKVLKEAGPFLAAFGKSLGKVLLIGGGIVGLSRGFDLFTAALGRFNTKSAITLIRAGKVSTAIKRLRLSAAKPIVFTIALVGLDLLQQKAAEMKRIRADLERTTQEQVNFNPENYIKSLGGNAATKSSLQQQLKDVLKAQRAEQKKIDSALDLKAEAQKAMLPVPQTEFGGDDVFSVEYGANVIRGLYAKESDAQSQAKLAAQNLALNLKKERALRARIALLSDESVTKYDDPNGDGGDGGDGGGSKGKVLMTKEEADLRVAILRHTENEEHIKRINKQHQLDTLLANKEGVGVEERRVMLAEADQKRREQIRALLEGMTDQFLEHKRLERDLNRELHDRKFALGLITREQYNQLLIEREKQRLKDTYGDLPGSQALIDQGVDLYRQEIDPTIGEGLKQNIATLKKELYELANPIAQITQGAEAIGTAFTDAFMSVLNGSATTQEALRAFFLNIANYFLDMAAKIIAKLITIAVLNAITGVLPGGGGVKGAPMNMPSGIGDSYKGLLTSAKGNVFNGGVKRYAMGGIVDKPTLFTYANGGTGRFGLMGEAGPEAIMPLKRTPSGKLGVEASGGSTSVVVNVDAKGTQAQGSEPNAQALGRLIGAAVQAELVKQKRPGGLLA